jgi:hypothetical protein
VLLRRGESKNKNRLFLRPRGTYELGHAERTQLLFPSLYLTCRFDQRPCKPLAAFGQSCRTIQSICDHGEHAIAREVCDRDTRDMLAFQRSAPATAAFMKAVVVETFDQGGSFGQREKDDRRRRFSRRVFRARCGRHSRDTAAFLPYFSIVAVCTLPCLLDGLLIVSAFNVLDAQKAAVMTEAKDAICGHAAHSLSQAGARPNSQPPTPGLESRCR